MLIHSSLSPLTNMSFIFPPFFILHPLLYTSPHFLWSLELLLVYYLSYMNFLPAKLLYQSTKSSQISWKLLCPGQTDICAAPDEPIVNAPCSVAHREWVLSLLYFNDRIAFDILGDVFQLKRNVRIASSSALERMDVVCTRYCVWICPGWELSISMEEYRLMSWRSCYV